MSKTEEARGQKISVEQHSFGGMLWFSGWLFTLGYIHLGFWKGVLALVVWPYFIGVELTGPPGP